MNQPPTPAPANPDPKPSEAQPAAKKPSRGIAGHCGFWLFVAIPIELFRQGFDPFSTQVSQEGFVGAIVFFFAALLMIACATVLALIPRTRGFGKGALLAGGLTLLVAVSNCARYA